MVKRAAPILLLLLLAGCASSYRAFQPAEKEITETAGGRLAAIYELRTSKRWGEVRIWSNGAETREADERTVIHVGIETRNACETPLELDLAQTRLEAIDAGTHAVGNLLASHTAGEPRTLAHTVGTFDFEFELPQGVTPSSLRSFRLHWWMHGPEETVYEQYTSFVPVRVYRRPMFYGDPWLFDVNYGFRWGFP